MYGHTGGETTARRAADVAQTVGVPVRWWGSYGQPAFLRLSLPCPTSQGVLFAAWAQALSKAS